MKVLFFLGVLHCLVLMNSGNPVRPGRRLGEVEKAGEAIGTHGHVPRVPLLPPILGLSSGPFSSHREEYFRVKCEIRVLPKAQGTLLWDSQEAGTAG